MKRTYDLRRIMTRAWRNYRRGGISFSEALHRAWLSEKAAPINEERISRAKDAAGVTEEVNTWAGWRDAGFTVMHGRKALFAVDLIRGSKGDGAIFRASFFSSNQVEPITA